MEVSQLTGLILIVLYLLLLLWILRQIVLEKGRPSRTMAWLLFAIFVPFIGIFLYRLIGKNIRKERLFHQKYLDNVKAFDRLGGPKKEMLIAEKSPHAKLIKLMSGLSHTRPTYGNALEILQNGPSTYASIFEAIRQAKQTIHLEYYIFEEGQVMDELMELLFEKSAAGVRVRIIFDGVGSWDLRVEFIDLIRSKGIEIYSFMPVHFGPAANKINYRNHRKLVLIDHRIGFLGGINISDRHIFENENYGNIRDTHLRIEGPAVQHLELIFLSDWYFVSGNKTIAWPDPFVGESSPDAGSMVQIIPSGPDSDESNIQQEYFSIINAAEKYVYISTPYFFPGDPILFALKTAALSGVDVRILLPDKPDLKWMKYGIRVYVEELLEAGVKMFFYEAGFIHAKLVLSDDLIASVGTANLDERSFDNNFEVNAIIYDHKFCLDLKAQFYEDFQSSREVQLEKFRQRPRSEKLKESLVRMFSPFL